MMQHRPLVFLDVETTGMSPDTARVLELGALRVENGRVVSTINQLIHPDCVVPPEITHITGITNDQIADMPDFSRVAPQLDQMLEGAVLVAHNVGFDYGFLNMEYQRLGRQFDHDHLCTVKLSRALYPYESSHRLDAVIRRGGYRVQDRHRAYDDAEVLYKFFSDSHDRFGIKLFQHMDQLIKHRRPKHSQKNDPGLPGII
ncbi:hypothetical protein CR970_04365 [Candidatus Saccharibacteria bacterium]|nr:MAG: hypothetical protein CR970_04365 [Candidatus Saccharibacteria bacterium]